MISNLFDRMKLPFRKGKEFLTALYEILGFYPHNVEIYRIAFSHKSAPTPYNRDKKGRNGKPAKPRTDHPVRPLNNERLEFLGDAVLESVVSDILFRHFKNKREGFLTSTRSKIVQREALNRLSADMGLNTLIHAAQGATTFHTNIGGNAFEALMGAIYLDRGYKYCQWFIANRIIGRYVDIDNVAQKEVNFKSKLLEWGQKNRININFQDISHKAEGKGFSSVLTIEGIVVSRGEGRSKKECQQEASKEALTRMRRDAQFYDSLFRAKEKRTAMEAEESFALPKIEEIEEEIAQPSSRGKGKSRSKAPVLEEKRGNSAAHISEEAYDAAYDSDADYEVIDADEAENILSAADYEAKGLPAPPDANDVDADEERVKNKRNRERRPKADKQVPADKADTAEVKKEKPAPAERKEAKKQPVAEGSARPARTPKNKKEAVKREEKRDFIVVEDLSPVHPDNSSEVAEPAEPAAAPVAKKPAHAERPARKPRKPAAPAAADAPTKAEVEEKREEVAAPAAPVAPAVAEVEAPVEKSAEQVAEAPAPAKTIDFTEEVGAALSNVVPDLAEEKAAPAASVAPAVAEEEAPVEQLVAQVQQPEAPVEKPAAQVEQPEAPAYEAKEEPFAPAAADPLSAFADDADSFEPYEVDNLPDITGNDLPDETADFSAEAEEDEPAAAPISEPATRPQLRHLSLDDFVFGIEPDDALSAEELDNLPAPAPKPQKSRPRKRKPAPSVNTAQDANDEPAAPKRKNRRNYRPKGGKNNQPPQA